MFGTVKAVTPGAELRASFREERAGAELRERALLATLLLATRIVNAVCVVVI